MAKAPGNQCVCTNHPDLGRRQALTWETKTKKEALFSSSSEEKTLFFFAGKAVDAMIAFYFSFFPGK